jgi:hypothetical protein
MTFNELLIAAIERAEIPLRFEPGAEEAVAKPVIDVLRAWITAHMPDSVDSKYDEGYQALAMQLIAELDGLRDLPE